MLWTIVLAEGYVGLEMNVNYLFKGINTAGQGFGGMDNNCFAVGLVTILGLAVVLGISSKKWYQRGLAAACAALILHTTLLTYSRGALVGLLAVGGVAVAIVPKRPRYMLPILIVAAVAWRFTGPELAARYQSVFVSSDVLDSSAESRLDLWRDCLTVIEQSPLFGVGPANWQVVASNYGWPAGKSAHSVWMETAAETGIPGVLALLLFFGTAIVRLWPIARARAGMANKPDQVLAIGLILSVVGFAVSGQFVTVTGLEAPYYVVMIAVVLLKLQRPEPATVVTSIVQAPLPIPSAPGPALPRLSRRSPATRISPSTTASR
jgi:O-antigen ligase